MTRSWLNAARRRLPGRGTYLDLVRFSDGFIPAAATLEFLAGRKKVLVVGDAGGRDSQVLAAEGCDVWQLDLAPQPLVPEIVTQSIEDRTPFPDGEFDGIVINEVIEHLFRDFDALTEVRRLIREDGRLVLSTPLSRRQDRSPLHVRVHTRRTVVRLLESTGFEVVDSFERGIFCRLPQVLGVWRALISGLQLGASLLGADSRSAISRVNEPFFRLERALSRTRGGRALHGLTVAHGILICARPTRPDEPSAAQIAAFRDSNRPSV